MFRYTPQLCLVASIAVLGLAVSCGSENTTVQVTTTATSTQSNSGGGAGGGSGQVFQQFDRMGFPTVNTAFLVSGQKDGFNLGDPATDVQNFRNTILTNVINLRNALNGIAGIPPQDGIISPDAVVDLVVPDMLRIDFSTTIAFPNGRRLEDDVIDIGAGALVDRGNVLGGGPGFSDGIDSNDRTFLTVFPYMASPNP